MTATSYDVAAIEVLWRREVKRFWHEPSRILSGLGQPLLFWLLVGWGLTGAFRVSGNEDGYLRYFFPGVLTGVLLLTSLLGSASLIDDRRQGFLQAVLAGPSARAAIILGKTAGAATVTLLQSAIFLCLAPLAGFNPVEIHWPLLVPALFFAALAFAAAGAALAWWLDSLHAYNAAVTMLVAPLWVLSGAVFPPSTTQPVLAAAIAANPLSYVVSAIRHALYGGHAPAGTVPSSLPWADLAVVVFGAVAAVGLAAVVASATRSGATKGHRPYP